MKKTLRIWQGHRIFAYAVIIAAIALWYADMLETFNTVIVVMLQVCVLFYVNTQIIETKRLIEKLKK